MDRVSDAGSKSRLGCHVMDLKGACHLPGSGGQ